ncbi:unnamed protein product [Prunus armeniaca]
MKLGKRPPGKPKPAPAQEKRPGQSMGPTSPGKPKDRFRLGFSPRAVTSTLTSYLIESNGHAPRVAIKTALVFLAKKIATKF